MTARVRRGWAAVGLYYRQVEQDRSKIALSDLDTVLGKTKLRDTKEQFWRRYKMRFPPEIHPGHCDLEGGQGNPEEDALCVQHLAGENLSVPADHFSEETEAEWEPLYRRRQGRRGRCTRCWQVLGQALHTASGWRAQWPVVPGTGHRTLHRSLNLDADTTKFVSVRLDTIYKYYFRAKRSTMILPMSQQPQYGSKPGWRNAASGSPSSGSRHWLWARSSMKSTHPGTPTGHHQARHHPRRRHRPQRLPLLSAQANHTGASQMKLGKPINGKQVATTMKEGTKLCPQFQRGECKAKPCPRAHRCAAVIRKDRVCGSFSHRATNYNSKHWDCSEKEAAAFSGSGGEEPQEGRPLMADIMGTRGTARQSHVGGFASLWIGWLTEQPARRITLPDVLDGWEEHNHKILNQLKPGRTIRFCCNNLWRALPMGSAHLRCVAHRLIPRCVITQPNRSG